MYQKSILILFLLFLHLLVSAQDSAGSSEKIDSLKNELAIAKHDSSRIHAMGGLAFSYQVLNIDSALKYCQAGIDLATKTGRIKNLANLMASLSGLVAQQGKFAEALDLLFKSLKIAEDNNFPYEIARANRRLGGIYFDLENYSKAIKYSLRALKQDEEIKSHSAGTDHIFLAKAYEKIDKLDSASFHAKMAIKEREVLANIIQDAYRVSGDVETKKGNYQAADSFYRVALDYAIKNSDLMGSSEIYSSVSVKFSKINKKDSALLYALKAFEYAKKVSFKKSIIFSASLLAELYDSIQPAAALRYYKVVDREKDSLYGAANIQTIQNLIAHEEGKQKELEDARASYRNSLKLYGLLTGIVVLLTIAIILYRNMKHKQNANILLQHQKRKLETTLTELKSTQAQLIQSEKMASLGELTAGIAHEIQNPLNFVNNFSEVSNELIDEMVEEVRKGNAEEVKSIAKDIKQNLEKIAHHGKRADAIVKGMLQHSTSSSGTKEPTDINALADEYLRLIYHGLRVKDNSFNATIKTDFDESIGRISLVPQDMGRVLLNLLSNAFYSVAEKKKHLQEGYEPTVTVTSAKETNQVVIKVKDNGMGISQQVLDKIYQPFFTTKPTGKGTGLGLSLSYDIITKEHGGTLEVETKEGEYAEFKIVLPLE